MSTQRPMNGSARDLRDALSSIEELFGPTTSFDNTHRDKVLVNTPGFFVKIDLAPGKYIGATWVATAKEEIDG